MHPGLRNAVNVALLLNQPLLLTGAPGSGKTRLADSVAYELDLGTPLKFETKSTSQARDLFYVYDALGRFHKDREGADALSYITFNALGLAILRTLDGNTAGNYLPASQVPKEPRRSVVLIDEIDKAPRDFPNDVLNELVSREAAERDYGVVIRDDGSIDAHATEQLRARQTT